MGKTVEGYKSSFQFFLTLLFLILLRISEIFCECFRRVLVEECNQTPSHYGLKLTNTIILYIKLKCLHGNSGHII